VFTARYELNVSMELKVSVVLKIFVTSMILCWIYWRININF
jgi:hypothetical protein